MADLSISDLTNFWDGFQEEYDDWFDQQWWTSDSCSRTTINSFCRSNFESDDCKTYCVNNNYCSLYWTNQAKICCNRCDQTCTSMGESVRGECWTPITTKSTTTTTTTRVPSTTKKPTTRTSTRTSTTTTTTTTKNHVTTSSFPTTNGTPYTKQPFGKSPFISIPIVAGLLFIFIVIYLLRRRIKLSLNMSTGDLSNDSLVYEAEIRPTAPSTDDDTSFSDNETNIQNIPPLDTQPEPNAPATDAPPSYDDCVTIPPPSYDWQSNAERDVNTYTGGSLHNELSN